MNKTIHVRETIAKMSTQIQPKNYIVKLNGRALEIIKFIVHTPSL